MLDSSQRVQVTPEGAVTVFPIEEREPQALTIQHVPFATTFALFQSGHTLVLDPTLAEEAAQQGSVTVVANAHDELCGVNKAEGVGLNAGQLMRCVRVALVRAKDLAQLLHAALDAHKVRF
jgi:exosome complex component RRP45